MDKYDIDQFINQLLKCIPLTENEVKFLCDKVNFILTKNIYSLGKGNIYERRQCSKSSGTRHNLRRCSWAIL